VTLILLFSMSTEPVPIVWLPPVTFTVPPVNVFVFVINSMSYSHLPLPAALDVIEIVPPDSGLYAP
jgi:hypothetical protein